MVSGVCGGQWRVGVKGCGYGRGGCVGGAVGGCVLGYGGGYQCVCGYGSLSHWYPFNNTTRDGEL